MRAAARIGLAAAALAWAAACAGPRPLAFAPDALRAEVARRDPSLTPADVVIPFDVDPALVERARALVAGSTSDYARAEALADALVSPTGFGLRYAAAPTTSARDVAAEGRGNCLSLSSLYIGLARGIGLRAYYLDASERLSELREEGDFLIESGHVSAVVRTERGDRIIDFDQELAQYKTLRLLDDVQALGHFYNNAGYEQIRAAQERGEPVAWEPARTLFYRAVQLHAGLARAWNNLGIAEAHLGDDASAELHYRAAASQDVHFAAPYNNLGALHLRRGELGDAERAFGRACALDPRNPYHHYHRALVLTRLRRPDAARDELAQALALKPDFPAARAALDQL